MGRKGIIIALAIAVVAGSAVFSIAYQGGCPAKGNVHGNVHGDLAQTDFDEETMKKVEEERQRFLDETADLRQRRYDKVVALGEELAKETPDQTVASDLQKEISQFDAEYDQKRLTHMVNMKKIDSRLGQYFSGYHGKKRGCGFAKKGDCGLSKKAGCTR